MFGNIIENCGGFKILNFNLIQMFNQAQQFNSSTSTAFLPMLCYKADFSSIAKMQKKNQRKSAYSAMWAVKAATA